MNSNISLANSDTRLSKNRTIKLGDWTIIILLICVCALLALTSDTFFTTDNIYALIYGISIQFFASIGFTFLIILGEIDLSVGAVYGFSGILCSLFLMNYYWPFWLSAIASIIILTAFGFLTGYVIVKFKLNSMMVTLGTMSLIRGISNIIFGSVGPGIYPETFRNLAKYKIFDINWSIIAMIVIILILEFMLKKSTIFKKFYYTGANLETANIYGIKSGKIKMICFACCAFCASIGGIIAASRITHSDIATGEGLEFILITASVVSGASLGGGRGSILKSALGLIFLAIMTNGMYIYRIEPFMQQVVIGLILILSVFFDVRMDKTKRVERQ
jgi:ribose/xylose/arabinose/galactoside ABC-type transport system permease subunit